MSVERTVLAFAGMVVGLSVLFSRLASPRLCRKSSENPTNGIFRAQLSRGAKY